MISDFLKKNITSQANCVEYGYAQVEPNHLSAQRTGQIYAQLPAAAEINVLENGQFVKYDYAKETVNFSGKGEWMLVYNEIKLYRENQLDREFAMVKDNYNARVYSPLDADTLNWNKQSRHYYGVDGEDGTVEFGKATMGDSTKASAIPFERLTAKPDMYELHYNEDPFHIESRTSAKMMPEGTKMIPRVFKTNVGDIFTTNCANITGIDFKTMDTAAAAAKIKELMAREKGLILSPGANGILAEAGEDATMKWQVVKVYTMPDRQLGLKVMRIQ